MSRKILLRKSTKKAHGDLCFIEHAAAVKIEHREVDDDLTDVVPGDLAAACLHIVQQAADVCGFHAEFVRAQAEVRRGGQRLHRLRAVILIDEKKDLV